MNRNVETKCIIFGEGLKLRGKNFKQNFSQKLNKKELKWLLHRLNFQKHFGEAFPCSSICLSAEKICRNVVLFQLPEINPIRHFAQNIFKELIDLRPFSGLSV